MIMKPNLTSVTFLKNEVYTHKYFNLCNLTSCQFAHYTFFVIISPESEILGRGGVGGRGLALKIRYRGYHGRLGVGGSILAMPRIDGTSSVLTEWLFCLQSVVIVVYGSVQQFLPSIVSFSLSKGITKVPDWLPYHLFQLGVLH